MGGALSPPPSRTEKDWRSRSWEGRIDCVGGGGGGTDPRFGEEGLLWFLRRSLEGDRHIPGCRPQWEQQNTSGTSAGLWLRKEGADPGWYPVGRTEQLEGAGLARVPWLGGEGMCRGRLAELRAEWGEESTQGDSCLLGWGPHL